MNLREKQEGIEQTLEAKADETERHEQKIGEVESKLQSIEFAISGISEDAALRSKIEKNLNERQREIHDEERNAEILRNELAALLTLVNEGEKINAESAAALDDLRAIGEDIEGAEKIVKERETWANTTKQKIDDLMQRLGGQSKVQGEFFISHKSSRPDSAQPSGKGYENRMYPDRLCDVERSAPMTHTEANQSKPNPKLMKSIGYQTNCQSCVVVYEARLRGYEVQTLPNTEGSNLQKLSRETNLAWIDQRTGEHPAHKYDLDASTPDLLVNFLEETVCQDGRYTLQFTYRGRQTQGHIISMNRDESGNLRLYDPQIGATYFGKEIIRYIKKRKMVLNYNEVAQLPGGHTHLPQVLRVDNMAFNQEIVDYILERGTR